MITRLRSASVLTAALVTLALAGCRSDRAAAPADAPAWPVSTPEAEGVDGAAIASFVADVEAGHYGLVDHFLMLRHGKIVADHHFDHDYVALSAPYEPVDDPYDYDSPDWHPYYRGTELHSLQSVSKSITSICIGIAIDEGHIPGGVETPAMSFFEAYEPDLSDPRLRAMTLEDLLTMRSGIDWNEMISYENETNSCILLEASDDWIQFVLDRPMREAPGTRFDYNSGVSVLLGKVVRVATGRRIDEYAREKLFEPLGITEVYWKETPDREVDTEGGLYMAPHDLARVAQLFLQRGEWEGRRIVSEAWVDASVRPHVADISSGFVRDGRGYGYQWWVPVQEDGEAVQYQGSGYGGQFPIVVPSLDLVIVLNAWNIHDAPERSTSRAVQDVLLPAIDTR